ncbi:MAG: hypothetical protein ACI9A7_002296 [Cyclobacteriaceae bacterium]|jgi:hypothetical protein
MKKRKRLLLACSLLTAMSVAQANAQAVKMEKNYDRTFHAPAGSRFDLINKYGEVIIRTWEQDSIRIIVEVISEAKTADLVKKNIDKIDVQFRQVGNLISSSTIVKTSRSGFFKELMNEVDDYSRSLFGGDKLTVSYEVFMPTKVNLNIENKFGNVYLTSLDGDLSIDLSHGDLKAQDLSNELNLKHSFGKSDIQFVKMGTFILRGAELKVERSVELDVESSSSSIDLGTVKALKFNSRNDKITAESIGEVIGEGVFTDFSSDMILTGARLDFRYGDIFITRIKRDFKSINILSESADINLILDQSSYINASITGQENKMILPNSMLTMQKEKVEELNAIKLAGFVGNTQERFSDLVIKNDEGKTIIAINELPLFSERE